MIEKSNGGQRAPSRKIARREREGHKYVVRPKVVPLFVYGGELVGMKGQWELWAEQHSSTSKDSG